MAIAKARHLKTPTAQDLKLTYEMALLVLFRLLSVAYAEDKDLLPYRTYERYRDGHRPDLCCSRQGHRYPCLGG